MEFVGKHFCPGVALRLWQLLREFACDKEREISQQPWTDLASTSMGDSTQPALRPSLSLKALSTIFDQVSLIL